MGSYQRGFTLVELMVVVAIIGLLSAVSIPNFQKYQARSKTVEAKLHLSAVYTAEAAFFSEYTIYAACLNYMGYNPTEEISVRNYAVGFFANPIQNIDGVAVQSAVNGGLNTAECVVTSVSPQLNSSFFPAGKSLGDSIVDQPTDSTIPTELGTQASDINMNYVIGAGGVIHKNFTGAAANSAFTINQRKQIRTIRNGY